MLILIPTIIFSVIGYLSYSASLDNKSNLATNKDDISVMSSGVNLSTEIDEHYTYLLNDLDNKKISWDEALQKATNGRESLKNTLTEFNNSVPVLLLTDEQITALKTSQDKLTADFEKIENFLKSNTGSAGDLRQISNTFVKDQLIISQGFHSAINEVDKATFDNLASNAETIVNDTSETSDKIILTVLIGSFFMIVIGFFIARSIKIPTNQLYKVVSRVADGEFDARAKAIGSDEIAKLSEAFNNLLDDRASTLTRIDEEHSELNQSVFSLLQTVAELSDRDLTIRANVTGDATGPVADALNLLAEETSDTLKQVKSVANNVYKASNKVNSHLMSINKLAMKEQERAIETTGQMNVMIRHLDSISKSAENTNLMANTASQSTQQAYKSVTDTLSGMSDIRTTVQDTGKKIKLLGERSQEISHVIEIIETIAERTTLLALNASMQAVAAGDEGKGFSVIAGEIQRLAESSSESTGQISTLIQNIQQETNTTIVTMDKTIEQVVDGTTKAQSASDQMQQVLNTTSQLVGAVDQIAKASKDQVSISKDLKQKSESILKSTQVTGQELLSLTGLSRNMAEYAQQLVASVDVFTLDGEQDQNAEPETTSNNT